MHVGALGAVEGAVNVAPVVSTCTGNMSGLIPETNDVIVAQGAGAGRRLVRPTLMGRISCLHASVHSTIPVHVVGEPYPPVGVIILECDVLRRTFDRGIKI